MPISLPLASYRFQFEMLDALDSPPYPGTLWHSVFGRALHNLVCVNQGAECAACMFLHQCDYTHLFQGIRPPGSDIMRKYTTVPTPHVFRMATVEPQHIPKGGVMETEVILPGDINSKLPVLIRALYAAGMGGLGKHRSRARLVQVMQTNPDGTSKPLLAEGHLLEALPPLQASIPPVPHTVHLYLLTPYKPSGASGDQQGIDIGRLLMAIIRRVDLIQYFYTGLKLEADFPHLKSLTESIPLLGRTLYRQEHERKATTTRRAKDASGFTGQLTLDMREHEELWPFLWVGQWLNVGKNASMGFGRYELTQTFA